MQYGPGERGKLPPYIPYVKPVYTPTLIERVLATLVSVVTVVLVIALVVLVISLF